MKRKYIKPVLAVESFQINAAIAGSCSTGTPIGHYEEGCGYGTSSEGNMFRFFNENTCDIDLTGDGGDDNDTPCYHGPINTSGLIFVWS